MLFSVKTLLYQKMTSQGWIILNLRQSSAGLRAPREVTKAFWERVEAAARCSNTQQNPPQPLPLFSALILSQQSLHAGRHESTTPALLTLHQRLCFSHLWEVLCLDLRLTTLSFCQLQGLMFCVFFSVSSGHHVQVLEPQRAKWRKWCVCVCVCAPVCNGDSIERRMEWHRFYWHSLLSTSHRYTLKQSRELSFILETQLFNNANLIQALECIFTQYKMQTCVSKRLWSRLAVTFLYTSFCRHGWKSHCKLDSSVSSCVHKPSAFPSASTPLTCCLSSRDVAFLVTSSMLWAPWTRPLWIIVTPGPNHCWNSWRTWTITAR